MLASAAFQYAAGTGLWEKGLKAKYECLIIDDVRLVLQRDFRIRRSSNWLMRSSKMERYV